MSVENGLNEERRSTPKGPSNRKGVATGPSRWCNHSPVEVGLQREDSRVRSHSDLRRYRRSHPQNTNPGAVAAVGKIGLVGIVAAEPVAADHTTHNHGD